MRTYYAGGTIGDAYVILCKLYPIAKRERILCSHHTAYKELEPVIREIYSLLPNVKVEFREFKSPTVEICGAFCFPEKEKEQAEYGLEPEYYPRFELESIEYFSLPESYEVLQTIAGIRQHRRLDMREVKEILDNSKSPVVLIGENDIRFPTGNYEVVDARGKNSIKEDVNIIRGSKHFYGPHGFLSFVAVSQKVLSTVFLKSQTCVNGIRARIEAVEQWRRFLIKR